MRPLRLLLDGFGCYRQPAEADFSDVDFFALTGPTGSGKSTLIDGLCFALYGTVPRWGTESAIAQALAPAAGACRVGLVFEAGGKRYAAVRALARDRRGQVHTREARLDLLDPAIPPDAPLDDILEASIEHLAEGPDPVKAKVQEILGLSYKHFTQSVLLPQGRFSDFLQAEPRKRQDLLVELLAFGVYEKIEQRARDRARLAADRAQAAQLEAITKAEETLRRTREVARARRKDLEAAGNDRAALADEEASAWADLRRSRDSVVKLGAPSVQEGDLAAAWEALATWAAQQHTAGSQQLESLEASASGLREQLAAEAAAVRTLMAGHGITGITDLAKAPAAVAETRTQALNDLNAIRRDRDKAARLDEQIRANREEEQVATELGRLLRATSFERWLCSEALDSLVAEASATLMDLSAGQYQLDRDDRNDLVVIDFQDAGARRPVHTLSGGETFQASLALALALSRQVVQLSAGLRELNSMFLDEGFGTLDPETLDTVATTLERLAADKDRMVGLITHVAALAERVPVRFVVSRDGATSTLRREGP
jgi:DNA repair exonuclease SbcCD ATPase subunit